MSQGPKSLGIRYSGSGFDVKIKRLFLDNILKDTDKSIVLQVIGTVCQLLLTTSSRLDLNTKRSFWKNDLLSEGFLSDHETYIQMKYTEIIICQFKTKRLNDV